MESPEKALLHYAVRLLARKSYSVQSMRRKLERRQGAGPAVEKVIDKLAGLNYLNDFRFAVMYARSRLLERQWGPRRITHELVSQGVAEETAERALDEILTSHPERQIFDSAVAKWHRTHGPVRDLKELKRLNDYLIRQGFSLALIRETVTRTRFAEEEDDAV